MDEILTDAIRYWEPRRIAYNAVLAAIVAVLFLLSWPESMRHVTFNLMELLFALAVLANVMYCAAYVVDIAVQSSGLRSAWRQYRWMLFAIGVLFASVLTHFSPARYSTEAFGVAIVTLDRRRIRRFCTLTRLGAQ